MQDTLKVLIVDDTVTYRQILSSVCSGIEGIEVIGTSSNGKIALSRIAISPPDIVLLDVSMPVMDGLEALKIIRKEYPDIDVIMVSGVDRENAGLTMKALSLGALDFVGKPHSGTPEEGLEHLKKTLTPLISLVRTRKYSRQVRKLSTEKPVIAPVVKTKPPVEHTIHDVASTPLPGNEPARKRFTGKIDVVGIGVSTGGPNALQVIIPMIAAEIKVPILAVQHMPPTFTASLAERLDEQSKIKVTEAKNGETIEKGHMYIAPGGSHMVIRRTGSGAVQTEIIDTPPVNSCKPSVDVLFRSIPLVYGANILSVILTGMGRDGASGVSAIRRKGGYCIIQDEATSVVWGMPQAVAEANDADEILPVERIAQRINEIAGRG